MPNLPRPLTKRERSVLDAMLTVLDNSSPLRQGVDELMVVYECDCGCPTIHFTNDDTRTWPVAEAYTDFERGEEVILFASHDVLWRLEWTGRPDPAPSEFPDPGDLTVWKPPSWTSGFAAVRAFAP